jgi:hypothetical protein
LAHLLFKADSWRGNIDSVAFTGASQGASLKDLLANLMGEAKLSNASLVSGDQRSFTSIFIDIIRANLRPGHDDVDYLINNIAKMQQDGAICYNSGLIRDLDIHHYM